MTKVQLTAKAKSLGIDTEGLSKADLEGAITTTLAAMRSELEDNISIAQTAVNELPADADEDTVAAAHDKLTAALEALESFLKREGTPQEEEQEQTPAASPSSKPTFSYNGKLWVFKETAPERFNFLKQNKSQAEWMEDPEAMELLVAGRSFYVESLKQ